MQNKVKHNGKEERKKEMQKTIAIIFLLNLISFAKIFPTIIIITVHCGHRFINLIKPSEFHRINPLKFDGFIFYMHDTLFMPLFLHLHIM